MTSGGALPSARAGTAAAAYGGRVIVAGGLSAADVPMDSVFAVEPGGAASSLHPLPSPIHDAAAATVGRRMLVFGGGVSEGSDHVLQLFPGPPREVGTLPQALSDLVAAETGGVAYIAGGWNGSATNRTIYATSSGSAIRPVGTLPVGVRYPAIGALGGRVIVAGGELSTGDPTDGASSFDPTTGQVTALPRLPAPTDHTASAVLGGRMYVIGGLRRGVLTRAIISWAPGESRWHPAGHLPTAVADASAVPLDGRILLLGGRSANGRVRTISLLTPR